MGKKLDKKAKAGKSIKKLRKLEGKLWTREYLLKIAEFDGATIAPANGAAARADAMGTLAGEHHKLLTSEKSVELVRSLARETVAGGKIDDPQLLDEIRVLGRDQREASAIPTEEAEAWTRLTCEADAVWHKAKAANDWASFETYVDRIVAQLKHQAELMDPKRDPYDVWLDQYERGLSAKSFDAFCDEVKATVVPLVHAIGERGQQPAADFLHAHVPEAAQRAMSFDLMKLVGLDLDDTTLAFTEHPFSEGFAVGDARIATHIYEDDCISNVYSIIHEAGHTMYELGVNPAYARTCLEGGTSMGIHESQSLAKIIKGVADGCKLAGCALVGGEMAEHPGVMAPADYDLAGFTVGVVDRPKMLDPANVRPGDVILGLPSTGVHSNGYSLVRKVIGVDGIKPGTPEAAAKAEELSRPLEELDGASLADALLAPTRIYVKPILELLRGGANVHAIAHITGGGITENLNRALADDVDAVVTRSGAEMSWDVPPVITYVSRQAELAPNEACKTFNMGVGLCLIVAPEDEAAVTEALVALGEKPFRVGECVEGSGKVVYSDER